MVKDELEVDIKKPFALVCVCDWVGPLEGGRRSEGDTCKCNLRLEGTKKEGWRLEPTEIDIPVNFVDLQERRNTGKLFD